MKNKKTVIGWGLIVVIAIIVFALSLDNGSGNPTLRGKNDKYLFVSSNAAHVDYCNRYGYGEVTYFAQEKYPPQKFMSEVSSFISVNGMKNNEVNGNCVSPPWLVYDNLEGKKECHYLQDFKAKDGSFVRIFIHYNLFTTDHQGSVVVSHIPKSKYPTPNL